jgi:hypothetical protein
LAPAPVEEKPVATAGEADLDRPETPPLTFEQIPGAALLEAADLPRRSPRKTISPGQLSLF